MRENKAAETYCVRSKSGLYYLFFVGLFFFIALSVLCVWLAFFDPEGAADGGSSVFGWLGIPLSLGFALLCAAALYDESRPRVTVEGDALLYYPKWKKVRRYRIGEITGRQTRLVNDDTLKAIGPMFGLLGSAAVKDMDQTRFEISYLIDGEPAVRIHSGMKNACRLDDAVKAHLAEAGIAQ